MTEQQDSKMEMWAIVDVMGHQRYAGKVTEETLAGAGFIRVDVPEIAHDRNGQMLMHPIQPFTKLLAPGSIHSITPTSEETARAAAAALQRAPVNAYDVARLPAPEPAAVGADPDDDEIPY